MSNKRITDLTELTTPTTDDVFPIVDIATNTTQKVQIGNLPIQTAVTTALATKQATLVSGTNIKTVNSTTLLGSGDIAVQTPLVSGTSIKTVNSNSLLGAGDVAVQPTLVSGTNIKTLNSVSLLGSGDIVLAATPSGVAGAIQFSNGSAFASDAANFFWDNTNKRLGIGTNAPIAGPLQVKTTQSNANGSIIFTNNSAATILAATDTGSALTLLQFRADNYNFADATNGVLIGGTYGSTPTARLQIKGSGSTSGTTALLVQNSAGTERFKVTDNGVSTFTPASAYTVAITTGNNGVIRSAGGYENADGVYGADSGLFLRAAGNMYITANNGNTASFGLFGTGSGFNIGTGLSVDASAVLNLNSTNRGFLPPRMTTTQKNAIASPAAGLMVYDSTTNKLQCYNGSTWNDLF